MADSFKFDSSNTQILIDVQVLLRKTQKCCLFFSYGPQEIHRIRFLVLTQISLIFNFIIKLNFEQHEFELHKSTYMWIFRNK